MGTSRHGTAADEAQVMAPLGIPCLPWTKSVRALTVATLLSWTTACSISGEPPRDRIEAALPGLRGDVAGFEVVGPASHLGPDDVLRIGMASCVRHHCVPAGGTGDELSSTADREIADRNSSFATLQFQPPRDMPTALPLPGWFGPLRGYEEMGQVRQLSVVIRQGLWAEVIAHHSDSTQTCWRSNWRIPPP